VEEPFYRNHQERQSGEVLIMGSLAPSELPEALNGIEFGAVWRHELQGEFVAALLTPGLVQQGMVVAHIVNDQHHLSFCVAADLPKSFEKAEKGLGIEDIFLPLVPKLAVTYPNGPIVAHALTGGIVHDHRVLGLRGYPHATPGAMQLEVDLVQSPKVHRLILGQLTKFFYIPLV